MTGPSACMQEAPAAQKQGWQQGGFSGAKECYTGGGDDWQVGTRAHMCCCQWLRFTGIPAALTKVMRACRHEQADNGKQLPAAVMLT